MSNRPLPRTEDEAPDSADADAGQRAEVLAEPSWFHSSGYGEARDDLRERYRQAWNSRAERAATVVAQRAEPKPAVRPSYRDAVQSRSRPPVKFLQELKFDSREQDNAPDRGSDTRKPKRQVGLWAALGFACGMAVVSGAAVGVINARYPDLLNDVERLFSDAGPGVQHTGVPVQAQVSASTIVKKPVATATLQVGDVTGQTNSLIPLDLHAEPAPNGDDIFLKISGLPDTAYLTSGRRDGDKIWALSLEEARDVKLMVPQAQQNQIDVAVAAFEKKTGELAAPVKSMTIALSDVSVVPASAPPPSQTVQPPVKTGLSSPAAAAEPTAIPLPTAAGVGLNPQQEAALQVAVSGDAMLERGDLEGARRAFEQAWNGGSAAGAYGMARSFDPLVIRALNIKGAAPDSDMAVAWYQRAADAGHAQARDAIVRLKLKP